MTISQATTALRSLLSALALAMPCVAVAAEVTVLAAGAAKALLRDIEADFASASGDRTSARFDTVTPVGPGLSPNARFPCRITQIRPIDVAALNQSREEIRQANTEARQEETPAETPPSN